MAIRAGGGGGGGGGRRREKDILHTPGIAFRHLPPKEGCRKPMLRVGGGGVDVRVEGWREDVVMMKEEG